MGSNATRPNPAQLLAEVSAALWQRPALAAQFGAMSQKDLAELDRERLTGAARILGLDPGDADSTGALAGRLYEALQALARDVAVQDEAAARDELRVAGAKFEVGEAVDKELHQIPWSYGRERVTAMPVNPETAFVYWEVTDEAIAAARQGLGRAGAEAWLNLRLYDVTGRLFDGTNAHRYVDIKVERSDRQWFVQVSSPGTTWCVELGMKSYEGYFVRIVRSGRVDFPRRLPAPAAAVEWLTVRSATGAVGQPVLGPAAPPPPPVTGGDGGPWQPHGEGTGGDGWRMFWRQVSDRLWGERTEIERREWLEGGRTLEWIGPLIRTTWEAGPFAIPVEVPLPVQERFDGPVAVYSQGGLTRVVYGPWQVVIRGLAGHAERRVLSTWEVYTSWVVGGGFERRLAEGAALVPQAAGSEVFYAGASELRWLFGSELRLAGASEVYFVGASELRFLGASETAFVGASEWRFRGASEWLSRGASEWRFAGASERAQAGASEWRFVGGSEKLGASEQRWGEASEARLTP